VQTFPLRTDSKPAANSKAKKKDSDMKIAGFLKFRQQELIFG